MSTGNTQRITGFLVLFGLGACAAAQASWYSDAQDKMGTRVSVQLWADNAAVGNALLVSAMAEFDRIEQGMSTYIAESEISRVNDLAHRAPLIVSDELFLVVDQSVALSELTDGAFDITFDSVGQLYDFRERRRPTEAELGVLLPVVNYKLIELDAAAQSIFFTRPGMRINLGGIAKGHAVESVIALLEEQGIKHAIATAGGDSRMLGDKLDRPWVVGIRDPNNADAIFTRLALSDEAISTSGDYERFFIEAGERFHHILSPATGLPVGEVRSVSVIGPNATMTDGLSTSVFVMGPEAGLRLINRLDAYEAVVITDTELFYSAGLSAAGTE